MKITTLLSFLSMAGCLASAPAFADDARIEFDKPPVPVLTPPPAYPSAMKGTAGIVSLIVVIDTDGTVAQATVAKSTDAAFEAPSLEAISKWKFKPAEVNGQPVKAKINVPIRFSS